MLTSITRTEQRRRLRRVIHFKAPKGYEFDCWKDENNKPYKVNDPITFNKSNVTLTAQWRNIKAPSFPVTKYRHEGRRDYGC